MITVTIFGEEHELTEVNFFLRFPTEEELQIVYRNDLDLYKPNRSIIGIMLSFKDGSFFNQQYINKIEEEENNKQINIELNLNGEKIIYNILNMNDYKLENLSKSIPLTLHFILRD